MIRWMAAAAVVALVSGCEGPEGPEGPAGPAGPQGERGPAANIEELRTEVDALSAAVDSLLKGNQSAYLLNTKERETEGIFNIRRWNSDISTWEDTPDTAIIITTWRFIALQELINGAVQVDGGFSMLFINHTSERVEGTIAKIIALDSSRLTVAEHDIEDDRFTIAPADSLRRTGVFKFVLSNVSVLEEIELLGPFGGVRFPL